MDADEPAVIPPLAVCQEKIEIQKEWEWCNKFLLKPGLNFQAWLDKNCIDLVPERLETRKAIYQRLRRQGLAKAFATFRARCRVEWGRFPESKRRGHGSIPARFSKRIQKEMMWRLAETQLVHIAQEVDDVRKEVEVITVTAPNPEEGMEFLPKWMRWVANHPLLTIEAEIELKDDKLVAMAQAYAKDCPNQAAQNMFWTIRGDSKLLADFWKQVGAKYSEEVKRTDKKPDVEEDEESQENLDHALSLEEMLKVG